MGTECVYPTNYYQESGTAVFTNLLTSGTSGGLIASIYPEISVISLYSEEGCVDISGGVSEIKSNTLMVYPNPAFDRLSVTIPMAADPESMLYVSDILGKQALTQKVSGVCTVQSLDISSLPTGMYFLALKSESHVMTGKFEVRR